MLRGNFRNALEIANVGTKTSPFDISDASRTSRRPSTASSRREHRCLVFLARLPAKIFDYTSPPQVPGHRVPSCSSSDVTIERRDVVFPTTRQIVVTGARSSKENYSRRDAGFFNPLVLPFAPRSSPQLLRESIFPRRRGTIPLLPFPSADCHVSRSDRSFPLVSIRFHWFSLGPLPPGTPCSYLCSTLLPLCSSPVPL